MHVASFTPAGVTVTFVSIPTAGAHGDAVDD